MAKAKKKRKKLSDEDKHWKILKKAQKEGLITWDSWVGHILYQKPLEFYFETEYV